MWGSVSHSRTLRHAAQPCLEPGFEPATFRSLVNLLYPLSYSRPYKWPFPPKYCTDLKYVQVYNDNSELRHVLPFWQLVPPQLPSSLQGENICRFQHQTVSHWIFSWRRFHAAVHPWTVLFVKNKMDLVSQTAVVHLGDNGRISAPLTLHFVFLFIVCVAINWHVCLLCRQLPSNYSTAHPSIHSLYINHFYINDINSYNIITLYIMGHYRWRSASLHLWVYHLSCFSTAMDNPVRQWSLSIYEQEFSKSTFSNKPIVKLPFWTD